jgi:hypothetical protein
MHGLTLRVRRTVLPRWLDSQPSLTPAVCGEEGPIDRAVRAETHTVGHNPVATFDGSRESVLAPRGNAQPEYPLRGILALQGGEDVNDVCTPASTRVGV